MEPAREPAWPHVVNIAAFVGALVTFGLLLVLSPPDAAEVSEDEQRALAPAPTFSWPGLVDGSYTDALEAFVADHFPQRDHLLALHFWLKDHRGLRDEALAIYDLDSGEDLEALPDEPETPELDPPVDDELPPPELPPELLAEADTEAGAAVDDPGLLDDDLIADAAAGPRVRGTVRRGILVAQGQAMQLFSAGPGGSPAYARAVNRYADTLPEGVNIYVMIVPTAQTFYLPESYAKRAKHEPPNIRATVAMLRPRIKSIDLIAALRAHKNEYIFYRTDHHWTGRGAYYAYAAFARAAGLTPVALDAMERRTLGEFRGSLYRMTRDEALLAAPDTVEYWVPRVSTTTRRYYGESYEYAVPSKLLFEHGYGYGVFLGGDAALMTVKTPLANGRRALLLKNSYGNALSVFLAAHYEELLIVDYRRFRGSIRKLIETHEVDDLIILNGAITANAPHHIGRVAFVLDGRKPNEAAEAKPRAPAEPAE